MDAELHCAITLKVQDFNQDGLVTELQLNRLAPATGDNEHRRFLSLAGEFGGVGFVSGFPLRQEERLVTFAPSRDVDRLGLDPGVDVVVDPLLRSADAAPDFHGSQRRVGPAGRT